MTSRVRTGVLVVAATVAFVAPGVSAKALSLESTIVAQVCNLGGPQPTLTSAPADGSMPFSTLSRLLSEVRPSAVSPTTTLRPTGQHPFWSQTRQAWVPAAELQLGEQLISQDGSALEVQSLLRVPGEQPVYNLEVETEHVYFAGEAGVLVHNACPVQAAINKIGGKISDVSATIYKKNIKGGTGTTAAARRTMSPGDDAGHIIGEQLGGKGGANSDNIFSQNPNINRGAFAQHENWVAEQVDSYPDGAVRVEVKLNYQPGSNRVDSIQYNTYINNVLTRPQTFLNP